MSINNEALTLFRRAETVPEPNWGMILGVMFCVAFWWLVIQHLTKG